MTWKYWLSVRHSDTHFSQHCTDIFHARSVLAQDPATTVHLCGGQPSLGRWTPTSDVVLHGSCWSRMLWGAQHERTRHHPRGHGGVTRPRRRSTRPVARTVRSRLLAVANSADGAAPRDGSSYPSEIAAAVTVTKHCGVRVPRNKQPALHISSTSHHLITAPHHGNNHHNFNFFTALCLSEPCARPG